jgi:polyisoprenoid-binding protein YceI
MKFLRVLACAIILVGTTAPAQARKLNVTGDSAFVAVGKPGFIKINGKGTGVTGTLSLAGKNVSGDLTFPVDTLNTGVGLRDKHMKDEFLETQKFPQARLVLKSVQLNGDPTADGFSQKQVPFTGVFTVHGVSRPLTGVIDVATSGGKTTGDAQFTVKMSEYGFREAKYLGMSVNDEVQVRSHIVAAK